MLSPARALVGIGLAAAIVGGCRGGDGNSTTAQGAPPEPQDTAAASLGRNPTAAPDTTMTAALPPDPSSPWPADTFDVRIDRWSFEVPAKPARIPACGTVTPIVTGDSIGPLRAGLSRDAVERICPALHYGWYYSDDQRWVPAANVRLGAATILLEFDGTAPKARVTRVAALDSASRTADGLTAGAPLADARRILGDPTLVPAKCAVFARWPSRPGLIARIVLTDESGWECSSMRQVAERNNLGRVPADSRIGYFAQESAPAP